MQASINRRITWRALVLSDLGLLVLLALAKLALHLATNGQYGFHRDELGFLDDARFLAWGYVSYPPLTPFFARVALVFFGPSLVGLRFFAALGQSIVLVLVGLIARDLGGGRRAQIVAALAVAIAPMSLVLSSLYTYSGFDYLWWVLVAFLAVRLLKTNDGRYWLGLGVVIGVGLLTKYTMAFCVAGLMAGVLLTKARRYVASPWLWAGASATLLIFLPNLIWQVQHDFISLKFLSSIHARDIGLGRTDNFLTQQLYQNNNVFALPLWIAGLVFTLFMPGGQRYRALGWMWVVPFAILIATEGRSYYLAAAYPMLLGAGAAAGERWANTLTAARARLVRSVAWSGLAISGIISSMVSLPLFPINSPSWKYASNIHDLWVEQVGWHELTAEVARIYDALPAQDKAHAGILAGNYGEAGALDLYGIAYGLPPVFSPVNSYWLRGYPNPPPQVVIVVGWNKSDVEHAAATCELAGHNGNPYGVVNEESRDHPDIFVCRNVHVAWPEFWKAIQYFG